MDLSGLADFSLYAIQCGDATDPGDTTFRDVFDDLIDVTREVSGFCKTLLSFVVQVKLMTMPSSRAEI